MITLRTIRGYVTGSFDRLSSFILKLVVKDGEEELFIQYGNYGSFYPCCARYENGRFFLWAANSGSPKDVRVDKDVFLKALADMLSVEILNNWVGVIECLNKKELVTI